MIDAKRARDNLQKTGWNAKQVSEHLGVSKSTARNFLNGQKKIPEKYRLLIPPRKYEGATDLKYKAKKEQRKNALMKYSINVPFKDNHFLPRWRELLYLRCMEWLATIRHQRFRALR